ncbi:MAG TPA: hypothetical protein VF844_07435, partial [Ktedonobacteraceae bacterium]
HLYISFPDWRRGETCAKDNNLYPDGLMIPHGKCLVNFAQGTALQGTLRERSLARCFAALSMTGGGPLWSLVLLWLMPVRADKSAVGALNRPLLVRQAAIGGWNLAPARGATTFLTVTSRLTEHYD